MKKWEQFYRDTWAEVNLDAITDNVQQMKSRLPVETQLMAVIKANAYGHGDLQVARTALDAGANYLAVAFLDEAIALRQKGIEAPILVLGLIRPIDINIAARHHITITVFQEEWLEEASFCLEQDLTITIHLKLDTGMGRIGIRDTSTLQRIEGMIREDERFKLEGVFTHFATADSLDESYFNQQLETFQHMLKFLTIKPMLIHASNSAAALKSSSATFNAVRYGISMYGLSPSQEMKDILPFALKPAFSLRSRIVHIKKVTAGDKISYGTNYEAKEEEWIGTLPIGYADGWIRKLQGGEVLINGMRVPIVGKICMDQCMIKLPQHFPIGTVVTLIGKDEEESIAMEEVAARLETINYEIPCLISSRVPRVFFRAGKEFEVDNRILLF